MLNNKCYAYILGNCSRDISREHYISAGILKLIGTSLEISGFSWLQGTTKKLSSSALTSKILCEHHNNILSILDDAATKFFSTVQRFNKELEKNILKDENEVFLGYTIERWLIKLYLGLHWSGNLDSKLNNVELYLLENLFHDKQLPNNYGLYFGLPLGSKVSSSNAIGITTFNSQTKEICAISCEVVGFPFYISIRPGKPGGSGKLDPPAQYHPIGIELKNQSHTVTKKITFVW